MNWVFQNNPSKYDLLAKLQAGAVANGNWWGVKQHRADVQVGDRIYFWQSGSEAAIIATGRVASSPYERPEGDTGFGSFAVDVTFEAIVIPPLARPELMANDLLADIEPFRGRLARATNFPLQDEAIDEELQNLLAGRLRPLDGGPPPERLSNAQLLEAIAAARRKTEADLLAAIAAMHPRDFEFLIEKLLIAQGYEDVEVTQYAADGGIDLLAILTSGGISKIRTAVQVKRTRTVSEDVVQRLRGSLNDEGVKAGAGLVITSGIFQPNAIRNAKSPSPPITLVSGKQLVSLLLKNNIGVRASNATLYSLALDDLVAERATDEKQKNR